MFYTEDERKAISEGIDELTIAVNQLIANRIDLSALESIKLQDEKDSQIIQSPLPMVNWNEIFMKKYPLLNDSKKNSQNSISLHSIKIQANIKHAQTILSPEDEFKVTEDIQGGIVENTLAPLGIGMSGEKSDFDDVN